MHCGQFTGSYNVLWLKILGKNATMRCGIPYFIQNALWRFQNSHNAFWQMFPKNKIPRTHCSCFETATMHSGHCFLKDKTSRTQCGYFEKTTTRLKPDWTKLVVAWKWAAMPEKLFHWSIENLTHLQVGTNVAVWVLDVDCGRLPPSRSVLVIVQEVNSFGMYKLGTKRTASTGCTPKMKLSQPTATLLCLCTSPPESFSPNSSLS